MIFYWSGRVCVHCVELWHVLLWFVHIWVLKHLVLGCCWHFGARNMVSVCCRRWRACCQMSRMRELYSYAGSVRSVWFNYWQFILCHDTCLPHVLVLRPASSASLLQGCLSSTRTSAEACIFSQSASGLLVSHTYQCWGLHLQPVYFRAALGSKRNLSKTDQCTSLKSGVCRVVLHWLTTAKHQYS